MQCLVLWERGDSDKCSAWTASCLLVLESWYGIRDGEGRFGDGIGVGVGVWAGSWISYLEEDLNGRNCAAHMAHMEYRTCLNAVQYR